MHVRMQATAYQILVSGISKKGTDARQITKHTYVYAYSYYHYHYEIFINLIMICMYNSTIK